VRFAVHALTITGVWVATLFGDLGNRLGQAEALNRLGELVPWQATLPR
jgi:hypothetical protein